MRDVTGDKARYKVGDNVAGVEKNGIRHWGVTHAVKASEVNSLEAGGKGLEKGVIGKKGVGKGAGKIKSATGEHDIGWLDSADGDGTGPAGGKAEWYHIEVVGYGVGEGKNGDVLTDQNSLGGKVLREWSNNGSGSPGPNIHGGCLMRQGLDRARRGI